MCLHACSKHCGWSNLEDVWNCLLLSDVLERCPCGLNCFEKFVMFIFLASPSMFLFSNVYRLLFDLISDQVLLLSIWSDQILSLFISPELDPQWTFSSPIYFPSAPASTSWTRCWRICGNSEKDFSVELLWALIQLHRHPLLQFGGNSKTNRGWCRLICEDSGDLRGRSLW